MTISVNENAMQIVQDIMDEKDSLECAIYEQSNGTTIIDAGIEVTGGIEVGRLIGEICLGGLGAVRVTQMHIDDLTLPAVIVSTNQPKIATMGSQYAGWTLKIDDYFARGSGPARALARVETKLYDEIDYQDKAKQAVIVLETRKSPPESVTQFIADKCSVSPSDLYCIITPTASLAGSVQISSRIVEVGIHKLHALGVDMDKIRTGHGVAPIGPVAKSDNKAIGIVNDCILYGGRTFFYMRSDENDDLESLVARVSSSSSKQYGQPFYEIFKSVDYDFYKVDPLLFSPAEITINDITTKKIYKAGKLNSEVLKQSFGI